MPRLRQVSRAGTSDEILLRMYDRLFGDRDPVDEPGTATGTPGDWWTVFALVPDVLKHAAQGFALYRSPDRILDPMLRDGQEEASSSTPNIVRPAVRWASRRKRSMPSPSGRSPRCSTRWNARC